MRFLLAEDNNRLNDLMTEGLRDAGHVVDQAYTVDEFKGATSVVSYDLYIVDLGLPDGDGLALIRDLRKRLDKTPILVVTARGAIDERIRGLDYGADDYMVKPFNRDEFLARVRALVRRPPEIAESIITAGEVELDTASGEARCFGQSFNLTPGERRLLTILMRRAGHLVPREVIAEGMSGLAQENTANAIEQQISRLRKALDEGRSALQIKTVRGLGYVLEASK
jgi:two-component system, OmpR family, response regulator